MSALIEQLKSAYPDDSRSPQDLTLFFGRWAEENGRADIFEANPDFASEYRSLRNEIRRAQDNRGVLGQIRDAAVRGVGRTRQTLNVLGGVDATDAADIAAAQSTIDARPASPETLEFMEQPDPGFLGSALHLLRNPKIAAEAAVESLPQSALSLAGGVAGGLAGAARGAPAGPLALLSAGLGAGAGSGAVEYASKIMGVLQEAGMDPRDPGSIERFFADESLMAKAKDLAIKRAIPVGLFDGATFAIAGQFAKPLVTARQAGKSVGLLSAGRAAGAELGMQAAGGAAGEYFGQRAADEPYVGRDIALEAVAEIASGPGEILSNLKLAGRGAGRTITPTEPPVIGSAPAPVQPSAPAAFSPTSEPTGELDYIGEAMRAVKSAQAAVERQNSEAASLLAQQQAEIDRQLAASEGAREGLRQFDQRDTLRSGLALAGVATSPEDVTPADTGLMDALALTGAQNPGIHDASPIRNPDAGLFEQVDTRGVITPVDQALALGRAERIMGQSVVPDPREFGRPADARPITNPDAGLFDAPDTAGVVTPFDALLSADRTKDSIPVGREVPAVVPAGRSGALTGDAGSSPAQPAIPAIPPVATLAPIETIPAARTIRSFDDVALPQAERIAELRDFAKDKTSDYTVAAILQDNQTGRVYQRGVRHGSGSELTVEMAQSRKGSAIGQGQGRTASADLEFGTVNRPVRTLLSETVNGQPRFSVLGYTVLDTPQKTAAVNFGTVAEYQSHPDVQRLVKAGYDQAVLPRRTTGRRPDANKKAGFIAGSRKAGDVEVASGLVPEAARVAATPGQTTITPVSAPIMMLEAIAADVKNLGREPAVERAVRLLTELARAKKVKGLSVDPSVFRQAAEALVDDAVALTIRPASAGMVPDHQADVLFASALQSVRAAGGDVVLFEKNVNSRFEAAQKGWGIITTGPGRRKIIALGLDTLNGRHDATVKLMHEVGHIVAESLPDPVHRAFHLAIDRLHWSQQQWALNPLSTDLRILANADPASLSPEQQRALATFTPEEIARARQTPREELVREQAAEHLAMLGLDKAEARGLLDRLARTIKDILLQIAIALQQAFKGESHVSERLARAYVENQFLSFIHADARALSSLAGWIGAPSTIAQRVTAFASLSDGDFRAVQYDPLTRELQAPDVATTDVVALRDYLTYALKQAEEYAKRQTPGGTSLTQRPDAADYTPTVQLNRETAAINLQEQHLRQIFESAGVGPLLPRADNPFRSFLSDWLGLPESQWPETRRQEQATIASTARDPLTNQPVSFNPAITVDALPAVTEARTDDEGKPRPEVISSAQDYALRQTLRFLQQVEARVQRRLMSMTDTLQRLQKQQEKKTLSEEGRAELQELARQIPILVNTITGAEGLLARIGEVQTRLGGAGAFIAAPGSDFPVPPSATATEEQLMANRRTIPKDLQFANRDEFFGHILAIRDWLDNPANQRKGRIYGYMKDVLAKLQDLAVTPEYVANTFRARRTIAKSIPAKLRDIGTAVALRLARPFLVFQSHMNRYQSDARIFGARWSHALGQYAEAMGEPLSEAFLDRHWNHLMRTLESINEGTGNPFELAEQALNQVAGLNISTPARRAALRHLILETRENERFFRQAFEALGLKVLDKELKDSSGRPLLRRLITKGYVTGRRTASRHLVAIYQQMNPVWSDTEAPESFVDTAGLLYAGNRDAFKLQMARHFTPGVVRDFAEPLALNNANHFKVSEDSGLERDAGLANVRRAWRKAKGDVTLFAELLHEYEGLAKGQEARTVGSVMKSFAALFAEVKRDSEERLKTESDGLETTPRQMMDARLADNWPAEWVSYASFDANANLRLLYQLSVNAAFGRDGFGPSGQFSANLSALRRELQDLQIEEDRLRRDQGLDARAVEKAMGADRYRIALQAHEHLDMLQHLQDEALKAVTKTTGYLIGDFKLLNELVSFSATSALQNPRSAGLQAFDVLSPFFKFKFSGPAFRAFARAGASLFSGLANSALQAIGSNYALNAEAALRRHRNGYKDPENYITWRQKLSDRGYRLNLARPDHPETIPGRLSRQGIYVLRRMKDLANTGPVSARTENILGPKLRPGLFGTVSEAVYGATIDTLYDAYADLATRGIEWLGRMSPAARASSLRNLESGVYTPVARDLGYHRKFGLLNDAEALAWMRDALESKLGGERGLGQFLAGAWRRKEQGLSEISEGQFRQIANLALTEWGLQSSIATSPHWTFTNPILRVGMIFLVWPWNAMQRFAESFRDPRGRITQQTILDGAAAFLLGSVPLTLAGSLAFDWYDERVLGKKQNIRELTADPVKFPVAALERVARYGTAGLASELVNQIVNYDTAKNLSLDNRVFAINQLRNIFDAFSTVIQQEGTITYGSVGRPLIQALGGSGLLHYLQVIDHQIPGVNNQDEAINRRINTGNYLRAAGRALDLDVRVFRGATSVPNEVTPWLQQMEAAALAGDNQSFVRAYQSALRAARSLGKEDPEKYVVDGFADRHPLRRIFSHSPTAYEYRRILGQLDEAGKRAVGEAVSSYNRQLERLGKPAFVGKPDTSFDPAAYTRALERDL